MATQTKVQISKKQITLSMVVLLLIIIAAVPGVYFYDKYQKAQMQLKNPNQAAATELDTVIKAVAKLMILPAGETPTLATVSDKSKLSKEPFFKNAQNGDKVLIYTKAKKAILYRPSTNIIIEVSPLNITDPSAQQNNGASPKPEQVNVAIYNGSSVVGVASTYEKKLTSASPQLNVIAKENAASKDYKKTLVIDLNSKSKIVADQIAQIVGGEVATLPKGEAKPKNADFLVIVGAPAKESPTPTAGTTEVPTIQPSPTTSP